MPFFSSGSGDSVALKWAVALLLVVLAIVLLYAVFRTVFGARVRLSGARGRQLRLGVVDIYNLDRERQLVIVRRDNVEHLLMVGGPNDLVIESAIVRAETREARLRESPPSWTETPENDMRPPAPDPVDPPPVAQPLREPPRLPDLFARPRKTSSTQSTPEPTPPAQDVKLAPPVSQPMEPLPVTTQPAMPPQGAPPSNAIPSKTISQNPAPKKPLPPFFQRREKSAQPASPPEPPALAPAPIPALPPEPQVHHGEPAPVEEAVAQKTQPAPPPPPPAPRPILNRQPLVRPAAQPVESNPPAPPPPLPTPPLPEPIPTIDDPLGSLEEEMAKLLGRPTKT